MCAGRIWSFVTVVAMASGMQPSQGQSHSNQDFLEYRSKLQCVFISFKEDIDGLVAEFDMLQDNFLRYPYYANQTLRLEFESLTSGKEILNDYLSKGKDSSLFENEYEYFKDAITLYRRNYGIDRLRASSWGFDPNKCLCF